MDSTLSRASYDCDDLLRRGPFGPNPLRSPRCADHARSNLISGFGAPIFPGEVRCIPVPFVSEFLFYWPWQSFARSRGWCLFAVHVERIFQRLLNRLLPFAMPPNLWRGSYSWSGQSAPTCPPWPSRSRPTARPCVGRLADSNDRGVNRRLTRRGGSWPGGANALCIRQIREGWHLDTEPTVAVKPASDDVLELVRLRAQLEFERSEAERAAHWAHVVDVDEGITEVDEEIAATGLRGHLTPESRTPRSRKTRSTRRRNNTPGLPRRQASCGSRTTSYSPARSARHSKPRNVNRAFYGCALTLACRGFAFTTCAMRSRRFSSIKERSFARSWSCWATPRSGSQLTPTVMS